MPSLDYPNPYQIPASEPAKFGQESTADERFDQPIFQANDRTNIGGRLWLPCTQTVYSDRIELKFLSQSFTIPIEKVQRLRSGGKRFGRHLEIIHDESIVPEKIHLIPLFPAEWYAALTELGVATEDETELRESKQLYHRSSVWVSNAEGIFWLLWVALIIIASIVAGIVSLMKEIFG